MDNSRGAVPTLQYGAGVGQASLPAHKQAEGLLLSFLFFVVDKSGFVWYYDKRMFIGLTLVLKQRTVSTMKKLIFLFSVLSTFMSYPLYAANPTIEERLIRLEEGQKALNQLMYDLSNGLNKRIDDVNKRIDDLRADINRRFEAVDKRFDDLTFWFQFILGALFLIMGGLAAQWSLMWKKTVRVESRVEEHLKETEKDRLITLQREEIGILRESVQEIRKRMQIPEMAVAKG